jgi:hypothetical protein
MRMESSDTEDAIEVIDRHRYHYRRSIQRPRTHLRDRIATTKVRAFAAKADRSATTTSNCTSQERGTTNAQIKALTDLVKSLIKAMEDQK